MGAKKYSPLIKFLIALCCVLLIAAGVYIYDNTVDRSGWVEKDGVYYYRDFHAKKVSGWQDIDGHRYYFGSDKAMVTHWQTIDGNRYYFGADGAMDYGWQDVQGSRYYLDENGILVTGWRNVDTERYYFGPDGAMATHWLELEGKRYYLGEKGAMVSGWMTLEGDHYYMGETGAMTIGWLRLDTGRYYFDGAGHLVTGKTELEGSHYYFLEDGRMFTGWEDTEAGRLWYDDEGIQAFGWATIEGKHYFFAEDSGIMQTGWHEEGEYRYYLQEDGSAAVGPLTIDKQQYYFSPAGIHVVLVNSRNRVPNYYKATLETYIPWHQVDVVCLEPLRQMLADCEAAGISYEFNSAYRSIATQSAILETRTAEYEATGLSHEAAYAKARQTVALPGTSEHHLGLAVDIIGEEAQAWLQEHCWEYGFILRYEGEKSHITGIVNEPWHFRYVGTRVSLDMKNSGLCLEEYLGAYPIENVG